MPQGANPTNPAVRPNTSGGAAAAPLREDLAGSLMVGKGLVARANITGAALLVKSGVGRVCRVSVNTAGSTVGSISDSATTGGVAASNLIATIPDVVGVYDIDMPILNGLVITPGTGQVLGPSWL